MTVYQRVLTSRIKERLQTGRLPNGEDRAGPHVGGAEINAEDASRGRVARNAASVAAVIEISLQKAHIEASSAGKPKITLNDLPREERPVQEVATELIGEGGIGCSPKKAQRRLK